MMVVQRSDLKALQNEIDRLWAETRLLRERAATGWDLALGHIGKSSIASMFLALPGLRGFWPMSAFDSSGNAQDQSGHGHVLSYNGNPTYSLTGLAPYLDLDGTGDFLSRADEADLDILGTESYVAAAERGLTFGGWFYPTADISAHLIGKANDTNGPYFLYYGAGGTLLFRVRDAADANNFDVSTPMTTNAWQFIVGRYDPSTEIKVWDGGASNTNVTDIPSSLLNGGDSFAIGAAGGGATPYTGRASFCFLCATALSDAIIGTLYQRSKALYGQ